MKSETSSAIAASRLKGTGNRAETITETRIAAVAAVSPILSLAAAARASEEILFASVLLKKNIQSLTAIETAKAITAASENPGAAEPEISSLSELLNSSAPTRIITTATSSADIHSILP